MNYQKIISVVNEHTASIVTSGYAITLAAGCKANLVLYAAHDEGCNETILVRINRHLDHLYTVAVTLGISVTRITEVGNLSTLLPKRVQAESADLVFYPMTPHEQYGANLRRHTVHRLLRIIKTDLAIVRVITMNKPHPARILVPLGKIVSDTEHRLMFVIGLARSFHSQVTLLHLSGERKKTQGMPEDVTRFREQLQQQHVSVLERSGGGDVGEAIAVEAITRHDDLIVLGASERGVFRRLLFGNPAGDVMHQPPCNTILFRSEK